MLAVLDADESKAGTEAACAALMAVLLLVVPVDLQLKLETEYHPPACTVGCINLHFAEACYRIGGAEKYSVCIEMVKLIMFSKWKGQWRYLAWLSSYPAWCIVCNTLLVGMTSEFTGVLITMNMMSMHQEHADLPSRRF